MKTEEDEAFEAIERRQGGFHAKQNMAMHKTQDQHICRHYKQWQHCHICDLEAQVEALAQPAQEPVGEIRASSYGNYPVVVWVNGYVEKIGDKFYTTPPQREWVGLTDEDRYEFAAAQYGWEDLLIAAEAKLKERNHGT